MSELALFGRDLFGDIIKPKASGIVADRFTLPPFSVFDARSGAWQERKRAWRSLGIAGELGRGADLAYTGAARSFDHYRVKEGTRATTDDRGTSLFDPVLCELIYKWFSPAGGQVVDPFAGGSVRGLVAGALGRNYWGCDLRKEQIKANEVQADNVPVSVRPVWLCGDSQAMLDGAPAADLVFSCPPYGSLEKYSDDPADLSAQDWPTFRWNYRRTIRKAVACMKVNRFACFVVGDFRDKRGNYRNFVSETISAFLDSGCEHYNEAILLTAVGSASMRVSRQFAAGRKLAKTHQNILVFIKGDGLKASKACGVL